MLVYGANTPKTDKEWRAGGSSAPEASQGNPLSYMEPGAEFLLSVLGKLAGPTIPDHDIQIRSFLRSPVQPTVPQTVLMDGLVAEN